MKALKIVFLSLFIFGLILVEACKEDSEYKYDIYGVAQKGPYIVGTVVTISELDNNLNQTGKNYTSTIIDDQGKFELPSVELVSKYVQLSADGNYFHELFGFVWPDRFVLTSIASLEETTTININILTHLEVERLKYLVQEDNLSFSQAKEKCYKEILNIFEIDASNASTSEELDISKVGNENTELLAISSIVQGIRQTSALSEFLTRIQIDIKEDGILNIETLKSELITSAVLTDYENISKNIKARYSELGLEIIKPDLGPIVDSFIQKSDFFKLIEIDIPQNTELGVNILSLGDTVHIDTNQTYCIALNQICRTNRLLTSLNFEDIESFYCRENIEITDIQDWGDFTNPHLFGSHEQIIFNLGEGFTGNSNLKVAFRNHGEINVLLEFWDEPYGLKRKKQYLYW
jgi:hypothetical protein